MATAWVYFTGSPKRTITGRAIRLVHSITRENQPGPSMHLNNFQQDLICNKFWNYKETVLMLVFYVYFQTVMQLKPEPAKVNAESGKINNR